MCEQKSDQFILRGAWISACNVMLANTFNVFAITRVWCCWVNIKKSHASCECRCNALKLALFFCLYPPLLVSHITDLTPLTMWALKASANLARVAQQPQANEWKIKFITPRTHHNVSFVFEGLGTLGLHNLYPCFFGFCQKDIISTVWNFLNAIPKRAFRANKYFKRNVQHSKLIKFSTPNILHTKPLFKNAILAETEYERWNIKSIK